MLWEINIYSSLSGHWSRKFFNVSAASSPVRAAGTCYGYFDRLSRVAEFNIQQMGFLYKKINLNLVKMLQAGQ